MKLTCLEAELTWTEIKLACLEIELTFTEMKLTSLKAGMTLTKMKYTCLEAKYTWKKTKLTATFACFFIFNAVLSFFACIYARGKFFYTYFFLDKKVTKNQDLK